MKRSHGQIIQLILSTIVTINPYSYFSSENILRLIFQLKHSLTLCFLIIAHMAKYVFLATRPRHYSPAWDHTILCISSVLKFVMQMAIEEDVTCFVIMRNKLASREIFRKMEMEHPKKDLKPCKLCVTTVDELCHVTKNQIQRQD